MGTVLTMNIYEDIKRLQPSREKAEAAMKAFDPAAWEARVRPRVRQDRAAGAGH